MHGSILPVTTPPPGPGEMYTDFSQGCGILLRVWFRWWPVGVGVGNINVHTRGTLTAIPPRDVSRQSAKLTIIIDGVGILPENSEIFNVCLFTRGWGIDLNGNAELICTNIIFVTKTKFYHIVETPNDRSPNVLCGFLQHVFQYGRQS